MPPQQPCSAGQTRPVKAERERRAWVRYPGRASDPFYLLECETELGWWAKVEDVSHGGMAVVLPRRLIPGTALVMDLPTQEGKPSRVVTMNVVHTAAHSCGWITGCQFTQALSDPELQSLREASEPRVPTRTTRVILPTLPNSADRRT
jgi:hypothetical protein